MTAPVDERQCGVRIYERRNEATVAELAVTADRGRATVTVRERGTQTVEAVCLLDLGQLDRLIEDLAKVRDWVASGDAYPH